MSKVLITRSKLDGLATTIAAKSGATLPLTIAQMDAAVDGIETGVDTSQDTVDAAHLLDGYTAHDSTGAAITGSYEPPTFVTQSKSATPTESAQTVTPDQGYDGLSSVSVGAISSTYVGSGITRRSSTDLTASGATVTVPSGYYESQASKAVASGTAGTPTATKGTVSNHAIAVTPSVTNTTGYITGGTKTGTAVSVSASELVSGTYTVTGSGMHDVTQYASASVASATPTNDSDSEYTTSSGTRKWRYRPKTIVPTAGWAAQRSASNPINGFWQTFDAIPTGTTVTPTTSAQTIGGADTMLEGAVTVAAIPPEYIVPSGTKSITTSGTHDVTEYASASVAAGSATMPSSMSGSGTIVGALNNTMNVQGTITATPQVSAGYVSAGTSGSTSVSLQTSVTTLNATTYSPQASDRTIAAGTYTIGTQTIKGAPLQAKTATTNGTVTPDAGYYGLSSVDVSVSGGSPNLQAKTGIVPTTSSQTVTADAGYDGLSSVQINAMPSGSAKPAASISSTGATLSTGTGTIILTKSVTNVPDVIAGYVASGTSGATAITLQATATLKGATTYHPSTSDQAIASGTYLTGAQTIKAVTTSNLTAANIKQGVTITVGDSTDADCVASVTGTYSGGGSVQFDTKTASGGNTYPTSLQFTSMKGEPKAFVLRLNAQVSSSGSTTYYYIVDVSAFGTTTHGNCFRIGSTRRVDNITSGYSWSYSGGTLTITSSAASRSASPGAFYSGSYELLYAY